MRDSGDDKNSRIAGCLLGGAVGDALGFPVEFSSYADITAKFGPRGITEYRLDRRTGKALISDDTQMTLFTAEGILKSDGECLDNIYRSYLNWLETQNLDFRKRNDHPDSVLMNRKELYNTRAPGNTCLSALSSGIGGTVPNPINSSKGCGGIMRVAPIAFLWKYDFTGMDKLAAQSAALTHGHPLGYLPAALLVHILRKLISVPDALKDRVSLKTSVTDSLEGFAHLFRDAPYLRDLLSIMRKAISLSENRRSDVENISSLGEGWVAEETLAIAVYCALRHSDDFSHGVIAAVNHNGDSDSTGAVTGNLLGARLGRAAINNKWTRNLELYDVICDFSSRFEREQ